MKKLMKEKERLNKEIQEANRKIELLEEENIQKSFGIFFIKPLFFSFVFAILFKIMGFKDEKIIGVFLISFFVALLFFSIKTKK